ncbi:formylmethanofuran dehydrogenase subunit A [Benzoatithermus flavus]|uniref:Formylmethanofuran dehydrogenase subunit A n=1 Tax=Benzoatithermus flavus TaxID=3108223 RepID=A0ABU8XPJ4_9PROT
MRTKLAGGRIFDPINGIDGRVMDLWIEDGRIIAPPADGRADEVIDVSGRVVMPGGIDLHSHIGGGKVNIARMMLAEEHRVHLHPAEGDCRCGSGHYSPSTFTTGYAYAKMGYTMAFEPAMLPVNARQAHQEMADIPLLDKGAYVLLGSDDLLLKLMREGAGANAIRDYVAWTLAATQSLAIKIVNPGGISAFKFNGRKLDLDEPGPYYGLTPRTILTTLADAVTALGVPHPIHVHGCNLGVPGSDATTLATIRGMEGRRIHLTHLQFHAYGREGGFSSGAAAIAELVNQSPNVSVDVGQVMFGQTVTASGDTMSQVRNARHASPRKWVAMDIECEAGCGVLPFRYRDRNLVNALQWCIGLELFLLIEDPWRIFLTTDHPNGAPFTTYPHLIRLLMDRSFRNDMLATLDKGARARTALASIEREYSLYEIAIVTRAGPARILGLDRHYGHLGEGAVADVTVYEDDPNRERMFEAPSLLLKHGRPVMRNGVVLEAELYGATHVVRPGYDPAVRGYVGRFFEDWRDMRLSSFELTDTEIEDGGRGRVVVHACREHLS